MTPFATHTGVYDLDFRRFGWLGPDDAEPHVLLGRVVPASISRAVADSVYLVLNPASRALTVRLAGILDGDRVRGSWSADAFRAGGGRGTFVMYRHTAQ